MKDKFLWGILAGILLATGGTVAGETEPFQVSVELNNGNQFTGAILPTDGGSLHIKPYWLDTPLSFTYGDLKRFEQLQPVAEREKGGFRLQFPSGNQLMLRTLGLNVEGGFSGQALWGEELLLPRHAVAKIDFLNPEGLLYFGPEVKLQGETEPVLREVRLPRPGLQWTTGAIQFPDTFQLEIDIEPTDNDFIYHVSLFDWERRITGSVVYEFSPDRVSAAWYLKTSPNQMRVRNWRESVEEQPGRQKMLFLVNVSKNEVTLILNGENVHTWGEDLTSSLRVHAPFRIGFRYLSGTGSLNIESIRLLPWDGEIPNPKRFTGADMVTFKDGKRATGILSEINETEVVLLSAAEREPRRYPKETVLEIHLTPGGERFEAVPPRDTARIYFDQGDDDAYPVRVDSLGEGRLRGEVWTGGDPFQLSVPLRDVQKIDFNQAGRP